MPMKIRMPLGTLLPGEPAPKRQLRFAAVNLCTVGVLLLGLTAILLAETGQLGWAALCILGCFCLDGLDGALARRFSVASPFGAQMDSLADLCGFGVATPLIAYHWLHGVAPDVVVAAACAMLASCAMIRLARFNVVPKDSAYFSGLPAAMPPVILAVAIQLEIKPLDSYLAVAGGLALLMVTTIPYPKFGRLATSSGWLLLILIAAILESPMLAFAILVGTYLLSGPVTLALQWIDRPSRTYSPKPTRPKDGPLEHHTRVAIIGAGFAGLGMAIRLKQLGIDDFVVLERASDVGGTWRDSIYPGAASDVPSSLYSYSFAPDPAWPRTFPSQPEIQQYLRWCTAEFGLDRHLRPAHEMLSCQWREDTARWHVNTSKGRLTAEIVVVATGPLSKPSVPRIKGLESFEGVTFHSARWDSDYDLHGKRVAVIGTGASAVQFIPEIQPEVAKLSVFQRTPPWVIPRWDRSKSVLERGVFRWLPLVQRLARFAVYLWRETLILGLAYDQRWLKPAEWLARRQLRRQVEDPELRAVLTPDYKLGCKRVVLSNNYYPALSQPNTEVVRSGIREVRPHSIVCEDGSEHPVDAIIFSTGFESANMPVGNRLRGRGGRLLADDWQAGAQAYLGTSITGFPNLFMLLGPNSVSGQNSSLLTMEAQIEYVIEAINFMERTDVAAVEVREEAQTSFVTEVQQKSVGTVWVSGCRSWYLDARGRNTTLWPGLTRSFRRLTRRFDRENYVLRRGRST